MALRGYFVDALAVCWLPYSPAHALLIFLMNAKYSSSEPPRVLRAIASLAQEREDIATPLQHAFTRLTRCVIFMPILPIPLYLPVTAKAVYCRLHASPRWHNLVLCFFPAPPMLILAYFSHHHHRPRTFLSALQIALVTPFPPTRHSSYFQPHLLFFIASTSQFYFKTLT